MLEIPTAAIRKMEEQQHAVAGTLGLPQRQVVRRQLGPSRGRGPGDGAGESGVQALDLALRQRAARRPQSASERGAQRAEGDFGNSRHVQVVLGHVERQKPDAPVDGGIGTEQDADHLQLQRLHGAAAGPGAHFDEIAGGDSQIAAHPGAQQQTGNPGRQELAAGQQAFRQREHLRVGLRIDSHQAHRQRAFAEEQFAGKGQARGIGHAAFAQPRAHRPVVDDFVPQLDAPQIAVLRRADDAPGAGLVAHQVALRLQIDAAQQRVHEDEHGDARRQCGGGDDGAAPVAAEVLPRQQQQELQTAAAGRRGADAGRRGRGRSHRNQRAARRRSPAMRPSCSRTSRAA